jgi:hypothetical protein
MRMSIATTWVIALAGGAGILPIGCGNIAGSSHKDAAQALDAPILSGGTIGTGGVRGTGGATAAGGSGGTALGGTTGTGGSTTSGTGGRSTGGPTTGGSGGTITGAGGARTGGTVGSGGAGTGGVVGTGGAGEGGRSAVDAPAGSGGFAGQTGGTIGNGGAVGTGGTGGAGGGDAGGMTGRDAAAGVDGSSGTGGAGGTGGTPYGAGCGSALDCTLFSDCCTCTVIQVGALMPSCGTTCDQSTCAARGIGDNEVACVSGRCVISRSCNVNTVSCNIAPPSCPAGQAPLVKGACFSGGCVPVAQCSEVASCSVCVAAGLACVTHQTLPTSYHCVSTPTGCSDYPSCGCMSVCLGALSCLDQYSTNLTCMCPEC